MAARLSGRPPRESLIIGVMMNTRGLMDRCQYWLRFRNYPQASVFHAGPDGCGYNLHHYADIAAPAAGY